MPRYIKVLKSGHCVVGGCLPLAFRLGFRSVVPATRAVLARFARVQLLLVQERQVKPPTHKGGRSTHDRSVSPKWHCQSKPAPA